jgi:hypothetical protein
MISCTCLIQTRYVNSRTVNNTGMVEEFWKNVNKCDNEPVQSFIAKFASNSNQYGQTSGGYSN